ncbi:MAG: helix-turn-helix transcriptional regulator [Asticcacaulis sp.]
MKNRLKVLRAEHNLSQADLAQRLEVSRQTVNAIETEKYDPSLPLAFKIASIFALKIEDIFQP